MRVFSGHSLRALLCLSVCLSACESKQETPVPLRPLPEQAAPLTPPDDALFSAALLRRSIEAESTVDWSVETWTFEDRPIFELRHGHREMLTVLAIPYLDGDRPVPFALRKTAEGWVTWTTARAIDVSSTPREVAVPVPIVSLLGEGPAPDLLERCRPHLAASPECLVDSFRSWKEAMPDCLDSLESEASTAGRARCLNAMAQVWSHCARSAADRACDASPRTAIRARCIPIGDGEGVCAPLCPAGEYDHLGCRHPPEGTTQRVSTENPPRHHPSFDEFDAYLRAKGARAQGGWFTYVGTLMSTHFHRVDGAQPFTWALSLNHKAYPLGIPLRLSASDGRLRLEDDLGGVVLPLEPLGAEAYAVNPPAEEGDFVLPSNEDFAQCTDTRLGMDCEAARLDWTCVQERLGSSTFLPRELRYQPACDAVLRSVAGQVRNRDENAFAQWVVLWSLAALVDGPMPGTPQGMVTAVGQDLPSNAPANVRTVLEDPRVAYQAGVCALSIVERLAFACLPQAEDPCDDGDPSNGSTYCAYVAQAHQPWQRPQRFDGPRCALRCTGARAPDGACQHGPFSYPDRDEDGVPNQCDACPDSATADPRCADFGAGCYEPKACLCLLDPQPCEPGSTRCSPDGTVEMCVDIRGELFIDSENPEQAQSSCFRWRPAGRCIEPEVCAGCSAGGADCPPGEWPCTMPCASCNQGAIRCGDEGRFERCVADAAGLGCNLWFGGLCETECRACDGPPCPSACVPPPKPLCPAVSQGQACTVADDCCTPSLDCQGCDARCEESQCQ